MLDLEHEISFSRQISHRAHTTKKNDDLYVSISFDFLLNAFSYQTLLFVFKYIPVLGLGGQDVVSRRG